MASKTTQKDQKLLRSEAVLNMPDKILSLRDGDSLAALLDRYGPKPIPDPIAAKVLGLSEEAYDRMYLEIIQKLKKQLQVTSTED